MERKDGERARSRWVHSRHGTPPRFRASRRTFSSPYHKLSVSGFYIRTCMWCGIRGKSVKGVRYIVHANDGGRRFQRCLHTHTQTHSFNQGLLRPRCLKESVARALTTLQVWHQEVARAGSFINASMQRVCATTTTTTTPQVLVSRRRDGSWSWGAAAVRARAREGQSGGWRRWERTFFLEMARAAKRVPGELGPGGGWRGGRESTTHAAAKVNVAVSFGVGSYREVT